MDAGGRATPALDKSAALLAQVATTNYVNQFACFSVRIQYTLLSSTPHMLEAG